jgi:hypothetical protein
MEYKETIEKIWTTSGGLITKTTAAKILKVNKSVLTKNPNIEKYEIDGDIFVSYTDTMKNKWNIKPRKKKNI